MNAGSAMLITAVLTIGMLTTGEALAQANCQQAKGHQEGVFDPATNSTTGSITHGGWLNGMTRDVFGGEAFPTADPTTVSFPGEFELTTIHGRLTAHTMVVFNFVTGFAAVLGHIDPETSTGTFAGTTGVLYFAGKTVSFDPFMIAAEISGEVCFNH